MHAICVLMYMHVRVCVPCNCCIPPTWARADTDTLSYCEQGHSLSWQLTMKVPVSSVAHPEGIQILCVMIVSIECCVFNTAHYSIVTTVLF